MNLVFGLIVLAGSSTLVWAGFTDPDGGPLDGLRQALSGAGVTRRDSSASTAAFVSSVVSGGVGTAASPAVATGGGGGTTATGARGKVTSEAATWLGVPYRWGGNTRAGVDCSGLTTQVYKTVGVSLPRVSAAQALFGRAVTRPQPGDLVAFGAPVHHVGICIGNGNMIHAPHTGAVVRVEKIWNTERVIYRDVLGQRRKRSSSNGGGVMST